MKKVLLVVSLISVLLLAGCNKEEKVENNNVPEVTDNQQEVVFETNNENDENSFNQDNDVISVGDLIGTFSWNKNYINDSASELNLKVELVLKSDGSAEYSASDGYSAEKTRGSFEYRDGKIIYTREYYNYKGANGQAEDSKFDDENNMTETFIVIDANTLQCVYRDQTALLTKGISQNSIIPLTDLYGTYSWEKNYINDSETEINLKVGLVLKSDGSAEYSASDGYSAEKTRGSFEYKDGKIIYTREYYNYKGANGQTEDSKFDDENNMTETFIVTDSNTLQGIYRDQTVTLKK